MQMFCFLCVLINLQPINSSVTGHGPPSPCSFICFFVWSLSSFLLVGSQRYTISSLSCYCLNRLKLGWSLPAILVIFSCCWDQIFQQKQLKGEKKFLFFLYLRGYRLSWQRGHGGVYISWFLTSFSSSFDPCFCYLNTFGSLNKNCPP